MMAIVSGMVCVAAGLARLGFVTELLSKPIRYGYMNGIALTVMLSQIPKLFGFSVERRRAVAAGVGHRREGVSGSTNVCRARDRRRRLALILVLKRWPRVPGMLIAVAAATVVVAAFDLAARAAYPCSARCRRGCRRRGCRSCLSTAWFRSSPAASRSRWSRSPTPACSRGPMRRVCARQSTRTRKWWVSASPTSPPVSFRGSRSAAVRRARRWRRPQAPGHS